MLRLWREFSLALHINANFSQFHHSLVGNTFPNVWQPWPRGYVYLQCVIIVFGHYKHWILLAICLLLIMLINKWVNNAAWQLAFQYVKMVGLEWFFVFSNSIENVIQFISSTLSNLAEKVLNSPPQKCIVRINFRDYPLCKSHDMWSHVCHIENDIVFTI